MGLLDALLGRTRPVAADLDKLFGLPGAAITLEAAESLAPTGEAAVCFKPAVGPGFADAEKELVALLQLDDAAASDSSPAASPPASSSPAGTAGGDGGAGTGGGDTGGTGNGVRLEPVDQYGYRWVVVTAAGFDDLVTRVHFVNSTLRDHGYDPQLLCSVFGFAPAGGERSSAYLVYLYKRGTFYPFVPLSGERRDNESELRLKELLRDDLAVEGDLDRWFPLWGLPIR